LRVKSAKYLTYHLYLEVLDHIQRTSQAKAMKQVDSQAMMPTFKTVLLFVELPTMVNKMDMARARTTRQNSILNPVRLILVPASSML
jgi:hypothetical protein